MKTRIITALVGLALLAVVFLFFQTWVFELVISAIAIIAIHEIYAAFKLGQKEKHVFAAFVPFTLLVMFSNIPQVGQFFVPACFALILYLAVCVIAHNQTLNVAKLGGMVAFSTIILACFFSFVFIKHRLPADQYGYEAIFLIILALAFAWGGDTAAYFVGIRFGKHKLAPVVSPKKTIEGAIGGVIGSGLLGMLCTFIARHLAPAAGLNHQLIAYLAGNTFSYLGVFILGMVCSVLGILGDLFASAVKRQCEIKDYGRIFPGHGGILDRFDSVLFIVPVVAISIWWVTRGAM